MKFFLDIVNIEDIKYFVEFGLVDGVIINLMLVLCEGCDFEIVIKEIM